MRFDAKLWSWKQVFKIGSERHLVPFPHQQAAVKSRLLNHLGKKKKKKPNKKRQLVG